MLPIDPAAAPLVACLCAAWCGSCRDYRALFDRLAQGFAEARCVWVDIEDHAEVLGDVDVDDFPTLLIEVGGQVRFLGAVTPHLSTAERLLRSALDGALAPVGTAAAAALAQRVRRFDAGAVGAAG